MKTKIILTLFSRNWFSWSLQYRPNYETKTLYRHETLKPKVY